MKHLRRFKGFQGKLAEYVPGDDDEECYASADSFDDFLAWVRQQRERDQRIAELERKQADRERAKMGRREWRCEQESEWRPKWRCFDEELADTVERAPARPCCARAVFWLLALAALAALAALGLTLLAASSVCLCARELARSLCARARAPTLFPPSSCPPRARPQTTYATLASTGAAVVATLAAVALPAAGLLAFALPFGACVAAVAAAAPAETPELEIFVDKPGNKTIFVEGAMQIFVRVQTGRTITLAVNPSENVLG